MGTGPVPPSTLPGSRPMPTPTRSKQHQTTDPSPERQKLKTSQRLRGLPNGLHRTGRRPAGVAVDPLRFPTAQGPGFSLLAVARGTGAHMGLNGPTASYSSAPAAGPPEQLHPARGCRPPGGG